MSDTDLVKREEIIGKLVIKGDLSGLNEIQRVQYYNMFCESLGLNPVTKPFDILNLGGKQVLYAKKDATEQLRKINGVSITALTSQIQQDIIIVTATGSDKTGRTDAATGAVNIAGLKGDAMANAIMKAETKAKRRLTLSICGLGILDETEIETIPGARTVEVSTAELPGPKPKAPKDSDPSGAIGASVDNPIVERRDMEVEIGKLASLLGADAVSSARESLQTIHDMEKSGGIGWDESVEKVKKLRDEIADEVSKGGKELF